MGLHGETISIYDSRIKMKMTTKMTQQCGRGGLVVAKTLIPNRPMSFSSIVVIHKATHNRMQEKSVSMTS
jgi:hypothetical protein